MLYVPVEDDGVKDGEQLGVTEIACEDVSEEVVVPDGETDTGGSNDGDWDDEAEAPAHGVITTNKYPASHKSQCKTSHCTHTRTPNRT